MSSQAPSLLVIQPGDGTRSLLIRRAKTLSLLSIAWMTVEAGVAIVAALVAGSVALLGFGLDSLIELASASTILWLYTGNRRGSGAAERRAQQIIAICFAALSLYVAFDAISALAGGSHPNPSWPGVAVAAGAIVFMPLLAGAKGRVAAQLGSAATAGDAAQSWLCAISASAVLVSLLANAALGWWWLDPITGLGIAGLAVREGREAWTSSAIGPPGGGQVGALLLSPFVKGGTTDEGAYNHFSLLRTIEDLFGLSHLGYAAGKEVSSFAASVSSASG